MNPIRRTPRQQFEERAYLEWVHSAFGLGALQTRTEPLVEFDPHRTFRFLLVVDQHPSAAA
jgi:hypothetical protein